LHVKLHKARQQNPLLRKSKEAAQFYLEKSLFCVNSNTLVWIQKHHFWNIF